ncbi:MAG: DUF3857 domain-containing protein [Oligosphaeraceae bacterium]
MRKSYRLLLLLALALWLLPLLPAMTWEDSDQGFFAPETLVRQGAAVTREKYPDADLVNLDRLTRIQYQPDGTFLQVDDSAVKIMTLAGVELKRVLTSYYNASYARAKISLVQILRPDGTVIPLDLESCTQEQTEASQMGSNIFDPSQRIIQVTVSSLQPGDILRAVFVDETLKPRVPDSFSDVFPMESDSPILHAQVEVKAPKTLPLRSIAVKDPQGGGPLYKTAEEEESLVHTWEVRDVPQFFPEPSMPPAYAVIQRVLVSTFQDWGEVSRWYDQLCEPHLATNDALVETTRSLLQDCQEDEERILALFHFVSQQVRYMGLTLEDTAPGYEPHDVTLTFTQRAGVCRDKAALLVAMLRCAGFEAHPVLIHVGYPKDDEVPQPFFNHAVVACRKEAGEPWRLMDPTASNTRDPFPAYLSDKSFLVATPQGDPLRRSPVPPSDENLLRLETRGKLTPEGGLLLRTTLLFLGLPDNMYRNFFLEITPEERRLFFQRQLAAALPGATLNRLEITPQDLQDLSQPLQAVLSYQVPEALITSRGADGAPERGEGRNALLQLPQLSSHFGMPMMVFSQASLDKRRFPLEADCTSSIFEEVLLDLPMNLELVAAPRYSRWEEQGFSMSRSLEARQGILHFQGAYATNAMRLSPEEYGKMKTALAQKEADDRKMAIFRFQEQVEEIQEDEAEMEARPDLDILESRTIVHLLSPVSWTVEQTRKYRVETYAGIESADATFPFNPAWEEIEVLVAKVTNGEEVLETPPENINILDAPWVASAPRYPAEKLLVLNLPGVQVGSLVELQILRTYRNRPFFSFSACLRGADPVRQWSLDILSPRSLEPRVDYLARGWMDLQQDTPQPLPLEHRRFSLPDDMVRHSFLAQNVPAIHQEPSRPPAYAYLPSVVCSSGDWERYATALRRTVETLGDGGAAIREVVEPFQSLPPEEKLVQVREWVEKNIRETDPDFHALPLACLSAPEITARDGYGNSADRAILYCALLKALGFQPRIYLATQAPKATPLQFYYRKYPTPRLFDDWLVAVALEKEEIWLNDQSQYAQFGTSRFHHCLLLSLENGELRTMKLPEDLRNHPVSRWRLQVREDGSALLTVQESIQGSAFGHTRKSYQWMTPEERRRHYTKLVSAIAQDAHPVTPDLTTDFHLYPGQISYAVELEHCATMEGDFCYLRLPVSLSSALSYARAPRQYHPLYRSDVQSSEIHLEVELPPQYPRILMLPADFQWKAPDGAGTVSWRHALLPAAEGSPRLLRFTFSVEMEPGVTPLRFYGQYQEAYRRLLHADATTLLLSR